MLKGKDIFKMKGLKQSVIICLPRTDTELPLNKLQLQNWWFISSIHIKYKK